ncbi:methyltransferase family protein [Salidesulfovibrio onnuriiensis]|uniref:methyltransferase family protein n=1 Tax=Salidesulfovibrio onnuriiensis TaxID=2583823 RepID=UPI0011CBDC7D|nr:isoprenylcysteine carboxylmethyltransferase family protein [Salidesulfovibrio onnuriiensis]
MKQPLNREGVKYLFSPFRWTLLMAAAFFIAAGRLDIGKAWAAFGLHLSGAAVGAILMWRFAPELANLRAAARQGTKAWDKAILTIYFSLTLLVIPVIAGLDVGRYESSHWGNASYAVGIFLYLAFFTLLHWAMLTNKHFEVSARIQDDRSHAVVTHGPYAFIRHPGYVAMAFAAMADSFLLGSLYSLIPGILAVTVTVVRTHMEDKMLRNGLNGYPEYAERVRYRLIPRVW